MSKQRGVLSVTAPIHMAVVGDRLHITLCSGPLEQTYAVTFRDSANAVYVASRLIEEHSREHRVYQFNQHVGAEE